MLELFAAGGTVLCLDRLTKRMVEDTLAHRCLSLGRFAQMRCVTSRRARYEGDGARILLILVWLAAFASAIVLHQAGTRFQSPAALIGLGAALGGAAGNLLDILRRRSVTDFIDLGWWPVFNLADVVIVAGLAVALLSAA
jgi:signal peptidase II